MSRAFPKLLAPTLVAPTLLASALLTSAVPLVAAQQSVSNVDVQVPLSAEQERLAERIGMKIHCPICSGESIAQSQTDISRQMMNEVRAMIQAGRPEQEILNTFKTSYGERILLEPPKNGINSLLWTLPIAFAVLGALAWWTYTQKASRAPAHVLSAEEEKRIQDLLKERNHAES